jgi:Rad3-related DNA helicase
LTDPLRSRADLAQNAGENGICVFDLVCKLEAEARMARQRRQRTVEINGQRWTIRRAKLRGAYGDCNYETKTIRIHHTLAGAELMDTLLHELIHARWPDLMESSVEEFANTMAAVLTDQGFCRLADLDV